MKAARQIKLEAQLAATESELLALLRAQLPHAAIHGDMLFFNSRFCPDHVRAHWLGQSNETLISLATDAVALRESLGLSLAGSPAQLYISACKEAADVSAGNRRGPRQLASWILNALGPN